MADAPTKRRRQPKRNGDPHHPGRPHDLDRPVPFGGATLPASEAVVAIMRSGEPLYLAAQACGLNLDTCYRWRKDGQRIASDLHELRRTEPDLTDYERAALTFSEQVMRAEAEAEALMAARLGQVASGGYVKRRTVIEYDGTGAEVARRVTEETMPPDGKALAFWLERRASDRWGRAQRIEHTVGAEGPAAQAGGSPLDELLGQLAAIDARTKAGAKLRAVETTAEDGAA